MKLLSIQVGMPRTLEFRGRTVSTGIFKTPVDGPVKVHQLGLTGDGQADLNVHGGVDKAVYGFSFDAYAAWLSLRPQDRLKNGAFGENLTFATLDEEGIYLGDTFALGSIILQAAQPRFPCSKLAVKFDDPTALKTFTRVGRPGIYFRVLQEGSIEKGDTLIPLETNPRNASLKRLFALCTGTPFEPGELEKILSVPGLADSLREDLTRG